MYISSKDIYDVSLDPEILWESDPERAIALISTRSLIYERGKTMLDEELFSLIHGTVVWCLCSKINSSVKYHIDYAELYRYETNIIHPPLLAGTCHVSPFHGPADITGGEFRVNTGGIEHYKKFGYKAKFASPVDIEADSHHSDWISVRYKENRGILHDGKFPHLSTPITAMKNNELRVILGFNCFTQTVGEFSQKAPEHSAVFNRKIKLYQSMSQAGTSMCDEDPSIYLPSSIQKNRLTLEVVKANPRLKKILILAAKKLKSNQAKEQVVTEEQDRDRTL